MNSVAVLKRLPIDVSAALHAICTTGKGRCWYCDVKLPPERDALREGWDVQRIEDQPVANIILVCPHCLRHEAETDERKMAKLGSRCGAKL